MKILYGPRLPPSMFRLYTLVFWDSGNTGGLSMVDLIMLNLRYKNFGRKGVELIRIVGERAQLLHFVNVATKAVKCLTI
jgi:hypothetical protein